MINKTKIGNRIGKEIICKCINQSELCSYIIFNVVYFSYGF